MPRSCTICRHNERKRIDGALVESIPLRTIADRYHVSKSALIRHRAEHLPTTITKAKEVSQVLDADELLAQAKALYAKAIALLRQAEAAGELRTALAGVREARGVLELLLEVEGRISRAPQFNVTISPEWIDLRGVIVSALAAHPDARQAVVAALAEVGADAAG